MERLARREQVVLPHERLQFPDHNALLVPHALVGSARRRDLAQDPLGRHAIAIGTSATPYLRASSGWRDTSTVTTVRPAARSSSSSVRQSVHSGCVNSTTTSPAGVGAPSSTRSMLSIRLARTPRSRAAKR